MTAQSVTPRPRRSIGWALWLEWFAIKLALEVSTLMAIGLVGLDLSIGLMLTALGQGLAG